jgi:hypothetical protein
MGSSVLDMIEYGKANTIRFHFEAEIPEPHKHLMFGIRRWIYENISSGARGHTLSRVSYYRDIVLPFSNEKTFIEDRFHGKVQDDCLPYDIFSQEGWDIHISFGYIILKGT